MKRLVQTAMVVLTIAVLGSVLLAGDITGQGMSQGDLYTFLSNVVTMCNETKADYNITRANGVLGENLQFRNLASAGTSLAVTASGPYTVGGQIYTYGSGTFQASATVQTANTSCRYLISINTSGVATATKGVEVTDVGATGAVTTVTPDTPANSAPIGYVLITASDAWQMGVTAYGVATTTIVELTRNDGTTTAISTTDLTLNGL